MSNSNSNIKKKHVEKIYKFFFHSNSMIFFTMIFTKELNENSNGKIYFIF